jgi:hypothetical protein
MMKHKACKFKQTKSSLPDNRSTINMAQIKPPASAGGNDFLSGGSHEISAQGFH